MSNTWLSLRINSELKKLLKEVSEARGETLSSFVVRSLKTELARLGFLSDREKKALGMSNESGKTEEVTV